MIQRARKCLARSRNVGTVVGSDLRKVAAAEQRGGGFRRADRNAFEAHVAERALETTALVERNQVEDAVHADARSGLQPCEQAVAPPMPEHLAEALLGAGDEEAAVEAWAQAETRGISVEETPFIEQEDLKQTMQKIEALRSKNL